MGTDFAKGDVATNLLKIHGKYVVFATGWCGGTYGENYRIDGTYDWVYWQSDQLEGPYAMPRRAYAMPHCGHSCPPLQAKTAGGMGCSSATIRPALGPTIPASSFSTCVSIPTTPSASS